LLLANNMEHTSLLLFLSLALFLVSFVVAQDQPLLTCQAVTGSKTGTYCDSLTTPASVCAAPGAPPTYAIWTQATFTNYNVLSVGCDESFKETVCPKKPASVKCPAAVTLSNYCAGLTASPQACTGDPDCVPPPAPATPPPLQCYKCCEKCFEDDVCDGLVNVGRYAAKGATPCGKCSPASTLQIAFRTVFAAVVVVILLAL